MNTNSSLERRDSCSSTTSNDSSSPPLQQQPVKLQPKNRYRPSIEPHYMSASWLASKLLRNSDVRLPPVPAATSRNAAIDNTFGPVAVAPQAVGDGDICLFHYPTTYIPKLTTSDMASAFELIVEIGRIQDEEPETDIRAMLKEVQVEGGLIVNMDMQGDFKQYVAHASQQARDQVSRIQFSWYQFEKLPRDVVGRAYRNLRHVDIRQNASLKCIDSIVTQLPHLSSLNISDCPNLLTLAPLAKYNCGNTSDGNDEEQPRVLSLRHLWVRGCNLFGMSTFDWSAVFDALSKSSGPLERMTLSRNRISYLESGIGKLKSLNYLFVEDNYFAEDPECKGKAFDLPDELGSLTNLRFLSLCGNNITHLPKTMGRLNPNCDIHLHRNTYLKYPPARHTRSIKAMKDFFHEERMALLCGSVLFLPHVKRSKFRANERLYRPGGMGYLACKDRFEEMSSGCDLMED